MNEVNINSTGGIGFFGILQIVFIVLKLCKVIDWSWWLVFLPFFISIGIPLIVIAILFIIYKRIY